LSIRKVHFIVPPSKGKLIDRIFGCNYAFFIQQNIFMLYPATILKENGFNVEVTDAPVDGLKRMEDIIRVKADAYCFYSNFLSREIDLKAASVITSSLDRVPVIFMGSDPTCFPENYVVDKNYYVIRGEPELTLLRLLSEIEKVEKIPGVSWMTKNKQIVHNPTAGIIENLDLLPHPDRLLCKNPFKYLNPKFKKQPCTTILTSRGCPYRCIYCVPNSLSFAREIEYKRFFGKKPPVKFRSPEDVITEFIEIKDQKYKAVQIVDDEFTLDKRRVLKICEGIKDLDLEIGCLARADHLADEELIRALSKAGVTHIDIGVESFCQKILDHIRKDLDIKAFYKAYSLLKKYGIEPELNVLLGASPLENKETIEYTLREIRRLDPEILHVQVCTPFPGTEFYEQAKRQGWIITGDYVPVDPMNEAIISYPHLSKKELEKYLLLFKRKHYLRPKYLIKQLLKTQSLRQLKNKILTMYRMFK